MSQSNHSNVHIPIPCPQCPEEFCPPCILETVLMNCIQTDLNKWITGKVLNKTEVRKIETPKANKRKQSNLNEWVTKTSQAPSAPQAPTTTPPAPQAPQPPQALPLPQAPQAPPPPTLHLQMIELGDGFWLEADIWNLHQQMIQDPDSGLDMSDSD